MKKELENCINSELIVAQITDGKIATTVGTLVKLRKDDLQLQTMGRLNKIKKKIEYIDEFIPYEDILKVSTGQKVLSR